MSNYYLICTEKYPQNLDLNLKNGKLTFANLSLFEDDKDKYLPVFSYSNTKKNAFLVQYEFYFIEFVTLYKWIFNELRMKNKISIFYLVDIHYENQEIAKAERKKYNSIYTKEYIKIQDVIDNPNKFDFNFHIEYEFIL